MRIRWVILVWTALCLAFPGLAWAAPAASFTTSRASGTAPLAVFFDGSASSCAGCAGVVNTWHDLAYKWEFDDPGAGTWALSGRSKADDIGPSAGHVFEQPGQYVVKLTVYDPFTGQSASTTKTIDVANPEVTYAGASTYCYRSSASGAFTGCPAGAQQKTNASFNAAITECKGATHRCLFRRGDTFNVSGAVTLDASAPGTIGAFGSGAKPILDASSIGGGRLFSGGLNGQDYRIMDLTMKGPSVASSKIYGASQVQKNALLLRVDGVSGTWHNLAEMEQTQLQTKGWHLHIFLVECSMPNVGFGPGGGNAIYSTYKDSAVLGNDLQGSLKGEHIIRMAAYENFLIAHNRLGGAHSGKHVITLRSTDASVPCNTGVCAPSKKGHIHANTLHVSAPWTVQVCGQVGTNDNRCEDTLVDGNIALRNNAYPLNGIQPVIFNLADQTTTRTTFRNNICNLTDAASRCADLKVSSLARALNNTCYRSDGVAMECIRTFGSPAGGVSTLAQNNLAWSTGGTVTVVAGTWGTATNNVKPSANPFAVAAPGSSPDSYKLAAGAAMAINTGIAAPNRFDFGQKVRPSGAGVDVGAWELGAVGGGGAVQVTLTTPTNPVAAKTGFKLNATTNGGSGTAAFTWDCDGNGSFEMNTGATASVNCPGLAAGVYNVSVSVTDASGTDTDALSLDVSPVCGDGAREGNEVCDGADLNGETCVSFGFTGGTLKCSACTQFDTSGCTGSGGTCGDGTCSGLESSADCFADCGNVGEIYAYDSTADPEVLLYEDWAGQSIDYSAMGSKSLGVIADCKEPCSGVAFVLDGDYSDPRTRSENTGPFSMGGDDGKWYWGIGCPMGGPCDDPLSLGMHHITFFPCSDDFTTNKWASEADMRAACPGAIGQARDIAFQVIDGPPDGGAGAGGGGGSDAGAGGSASNGASSGGAAEDPGGCGCTAGSASGAAGWGALAALLLLGVGGRRKRRAS